MPASSAHDIDKDNDMIDLANRHTRRARFARMRQSMNRFLRREDGTAAIEFTIIMSLFLIPAWLGFAEVTRTQERMTMLNTTTSMVADMIARFPQVDQTDLDTIMTTAEYVMGTNTQRNDLTMMVMGVIVPQEKPAGTSGPQDQPWVAWSMSNKPGESTCVLSEALPDGLGTPTTTDRFIIVVDGNLIHDSPLSFSRLTPEELNQRAIFAPRETATRAGPNPCSNPNV